ncbi:integrase [Alkalibacillus filiformis]|uniref:Integrase n=1 Tax=Alkalibacillus filiformis TaxID=200990 RepID=A0ABU0DVI9_9BACI|nr:site-specific integrase [Alkalibacillus filiformis]MDQ0352467.1 integrase [Alkalibacillus filiformis]
MASVKKYTKKDGSTAYMFNAYLGVDPVTGKKKRTTRRGFKTAKEAKIALSKLLIEVDDYGLRRDESITYGEVFQEWFEQHKKEIKPSSVNVLETKFKRILPKFGRLKIKEITRIYCQRVVNEWAEEIKSFQDYKIQANQVFKYAVKTNIIKTNPMDQITLPKRKNKLNYDLEEEEKVSFYSREELKQFLAVLEEGSLNHAFFRLLAFTGARKGEIYGLHWSDIDFETKSLHLKKTLARVNNKRVLTPTKTASSRRIISLDDETLRVLKKWRSHQMQLYLKMSVPFKSNDKQPVFTTYDYINQRFNFMRLASINERLQTIYRQNDHLPQIKIHGFRHTHASLLFEAGASIKDVQVRLGHSDIQTTMNIYTHVTNEAKEKTADLFQKYMSF